MSGFLLCKMSRPFRVLITLLCMVFGLFTQAQTVTIGTGTSTQRYPLSTYYGFQRDASLYTAAEANIPAGGSVLSIAWNATVATSIATPVKIYLKSVPAATTTITAQNWATATTGATLVYNGTINSIPTGWNTVTLQNPYYYNGTENLMVLVETNYGGGGNGTSTGNSFTYSTSASKHMYLETDTTAPTGNGTVDGNRPNVQLTFGPPPSCLPPIGLTSGTITATSAPISWTAPSSTVGVGYDVYYSTTNIPPTATTVLNAANSVSTSGTGTTANLTGLTSDTFYYVWARAKCTATDNSAWEGGTRFYTSNYCTPVTSNQNSWISSFTSTTANTNMAYSSATANSAATFGYKNLMSSNNISIAKSSSNTVIPVSITAGGPTVGMAVWVDLNQNNIFDASEKLYATTAYTTTTSGATLTIPANTSVGTYRMRVLINYNNSAPTDPCLGFSRGEIIDYSLIVTAPLATNELSGTKNEIKVYPNPFTDILNISDVSNVRTVYVTDIAGRLVKTITHPESSVHLNELKQGIYLITFDMKDGSKQTFKAIKR